MIVDLDCMHDSLSCVHNNVGLWAGSKKPLSDVHDESMGDTGNWCSGYKLGSV